LKIVFLGTGTSTGVPVIGCKCDVCLSTDHRDKRTRPSVMFMKDGFNLLVDASTELRIQMIKADIDRIDGVLLTHFHADHIFGLDDTRVLTNRSGKPLEIFCSSQTEAEVRQAYSYVFKKTQRGGGKPSFKFNSLSETKKIGPFNVSTFPVYHGRIIISAFIIDKCAYISDASYIDPKYIETIKNECSFAIINGLRMKPHKTHFTFAESGFLLGYTGLKGRIIHISHDKKHSDIIKMLPNGIEPAYDLEELEFEHSAEKVEQKE